jgi:RNA polymerase sigma factor (sigma-70 family)
MYQSFSERIAGNPGSYMAGPDSREQLYRKYRPRLVVFCRNMTGCAIEEAEDLAQDVLEKAFARHREYNSRWAYSTWLFSIARNRCIDVHRRRDRRSDANFPIPGGHADDVLTIVPHGGPGPEEQVLQVELQDFVRQYIESLGGSDRAIAFLHWYEDMKYADIGKVLAMPVGTVKYRVFRIKDGLKHAMEEYHGR